MNGRASVACRGEPLVATVVHPLQCNLQHIHQRLGGQHLWPIPLLMIKATIRCGILKGISVVALRPATLKDPASFASPTTAAFDRYGTPARSAAATTLCTIAGEFLTDRIWQPPELSRLWSVSQPCTIHPALYAKSAPQAQGQNE